MNIPLGKYFGALSFLILVSFSQANSLPPDFWIAEDVKINPKPRQIWVDTFSMETARESIKKNEREYHLFKTELPGKLQEATIQELMTIAPSKILWNQKPSSDLWILKGNVIYLSDSMFDKGTIRDMTTQLSNALKIKRLRTEVFLYDTQISSENYVVKFQTGWSDGKEKNLTLDETAQFIAKTIKNYLSSK
jgi:hypothetical protein